MTPEQQAALAAVRHALHELPPQVSPGLAPNWISELRHVLQQVADAFPEEGEQS